MNILVCPDSYKGTLKSIEISEIISRKLISKGFNVKAVPVGDGGEGTVDAILHSGTGRKKFIKVKDPLGREIDSFYGIKEDTAYIEVAQSSGLILLGKEELNPLITSTHGFGQLIKDALSENINEFFLAIGGSATNDFGIGMLQALGVKFFDGKKVEIEERKNEGYGAQVLSKIKFIDDSELKKLVNNIQVKVLCDVTNPLYGPEGASLIFARQKGANDEDIIFLENSIIAFSKIVEKKYHKNPDFPGAGAAGGLGAALKLFLNAEIINGIKGVIELLNLEELIKNSDLIIVGEGSMDYQSLYGKAPLGIAEIAKKYNKKVIAVNGKTDDSASIFLSRQIDVIYSCFENKNYDSDFLQKNTKEKLEKIIDLLSDKLNNSNNENKINVI